MKNVWIINGLMMRNTRPIAMANDSAISAIDFAVGFLCFSKTHQLEEAPPQ
jgi:hypothetical protein